MSDAGIPFDRDLSDELRDRVDHVAEAAEDALWAKVAELFPTAKSGDFPPEMNHHLSTTVRSAIAAWVYYNVPRPATTEVVHAEIVERLRLTNQAAETQVTYEYPGFINVRISPDLTLGFWDDDGFDMHVKDRDQEVIGILPLCLTEDELQDADLIADRILAAAGLRR